MKKKFLIKVEFYDVDSMGVTWHGNYVRFTESARCKFLQEIGYTYTDMKNDGYSYPVVRMDFKFVNPSFFDDDLEVEVSLDDYETFLSFSYKIKNPKTNKIICLAHTKQVAISISDFSTCYVLPDEIINKIKENT